MPNPDWLETKEEQLAIEQRQVKSRKVTVMPEDHRGCDCDWCTDKPRRANWFLVTHSGE